MERYERLLAISGELAQAECPIIFKKGALLKDNKIGRNVLQLQFQNIGVKKIKAVYVSVQCFDLEKQEIEKIEKIYLDLDISYSDIFGDRLTVELQNDISRSFKIWVKKVIFSDDSITEYKKIAKKIRKSENLNCLGELKNQFIREVKNERSETACIIKPTEDEGLWYCTCGAINFKDNEYCGKCKIMKDPLFSFLDVELLKERRIQHLKLKEEAEKERKLQEERRAEELRIQEQVRIEKNNLRKRKIKKISIFFSVVAIILGIIYMSIGTYITSWMKYSIAVHAINNSDYEKGYQILTELGDYKDSSEQILAGKYKEALEYIDNGQYDLGYEILESLGDYSDAAEQILISKYAVAEKNLNSGAYEKAIDGFMEIVGFSDCRTRIKEARYLYAKELMNQKEYSSAMEEFRKLKSEEYEDSNELYKECAYEYANKLFAEKDYYAAVTNYERAGDYKDSENKILEAKYQYCKKERDISHGFVRDYISQLVYKDYKDSKELYEEITKPKISIVVNNSESDDTTNKSSLSKYDKWYFHIHLISCIPGEKVKLKCSLKFPDGGVKNSSETLMLNHKYTIWGWYSGNASAGKTGTATLNVYTEDGTLIGSKSVTIY